jgi:hypothetical protein
VVAVCKRKQGRGRATPSHVARAEEILRGQTQPEALRLYYLMRPHRGSGGWQAYEDAKCYVARTTTLARDYDQWICLIINYLNV